MKTTPIRLTSTIAALSMSTALLAEPPGQLWALKQALIRYHDSGQYHHDIQMTTKAAETCLKNHHRGIKQTSPSNKWAVVFDIDETALSNYAHMRALDFGGRLSSIKAQEKTGDDTPIKPTLRLFNLAKKYHIAIFFITGRTPDERSITIRNLHQAGYSGWQSITFKSAAYADQTAARYKTQIRKAITQSGYHILFTIGDQNSDLRGGYADKTFKLVNPYYHIP